jgi:uncharacterized membrane protein
VALPTITLPDFPLLTDSLGTLLAKVPFEIPTLLHPPLVHFAIALPVIIALLELFNILAKMKATPESPRGKGLSGVSLLLIIILLAVALGAYATGVADGKNGWDMLTDAAKADVRAHKLFGAYIVLASALLVLFKLISLIGNKSRFFFLLLTIGFTIISLQQGKQGGELVYQHGVNVARVVEITSDLDDANEELSELEEKQSTVGNNLKELTDAKKALEANLTTIAESNIRLQEEKDALHETIKNLKEESKQALSVAEEKAAVMLQSVKDEAKSMIESIKEETAKAIESAKGEAVESIEDTNSTDTNSTD